MSNESDTNEGAARSVAGPLPTEPRAQVQPAPQPSGPGQAPDTAGAGQPGRPGPPRTPAPTPPKPGPARPGPRPGPPVSSTSPTPVPATASAAAAAAGADAPLDPADIEAAAAFGRVDGEGTVYVSEAGGERVVGQFPDVPAPEAMLLYIRRFLDLQAQVSLAQARLPQLTGRDIDTTIANLNEALAEPAAVGDLDGLRGKLAQLTEQATTRKQELAAERAAAREQALADRTALVERAEELAALDPAKVQWRSHGEELRQLLESWKSAQRSGVRLDRSDEDGLWKRFAKARGTFDRTRRAHFSELDAEHKRAKAAKEALISRAEALQNSTDWGPTSAAYRALMDEWKQAGRAARKDDDALWARFRAAQDVFFDARSAQNAATDAEYAANLEVKNAILTEAEALLPVTDIGAAKTVLRALQDRWEAAGKVPRDAIQRVEGRMRAVEQAVRGAEDKQWRRSNPRIRARAEGAAAQLEEAIAGLQTELDQAKATGDQRAIAKATEALEARQAWLTQVMRAADDAR